ncbi:MAG: DUF4407 domain-containing protein [Ferruginibacter sp.]
MLSRKRKRDKLKDWLCKFSGEDFQLIHYAKTDVRVRSKFAFIGAFVAVIFVISLYSSAHFIYQLFNKNFLLACPIGVLWGLMIANIYLLLLYTITPKILPGQERTIRGVVVSIPEKQGVLVNITLILRIGFMVLLAIIIAQPWLITTFSKLSHPALESYKQEYRNDFIIQADSNLISQETNIFQNASRAINLVSNADRDSIILEQAKEKVFLKIHDDESFLARAAILQDKKANIKKHWSPKDYKRLQVVNDEITSLVKGEIQTDSAFVLDTSTLLSGNPETDRVLNALKLELIQIIKEKNKRYNKLDEVLNASNFYIREIQIINSQFPVSWLMTMFVVFIFILPIFLKYRIRKSSNFYEVKKTMEEGIIKAGYDNFFERYSHIFKHRFNADVKFYESCVDPPFNTIKKRDVRNFKPQSLLLNQIYHEDETSEINKYIVTEWTSVIE